MNGNESTARGPRLSVLRFRVFGTGVRHGISTRHGGTSAGEFATLNLAGRVGDDPAAVEQNQRAFLTELGHTPESTVGVRQVHSGRVVVTGHADRGRGLLPGAPPEAADGIITADPDTALIVLAADCTPILLWDPEHAVAGAVHAGWRGTVAGIAMNAIDLMGRTFGTRPGAVRAGIGPAIGPCCYEVDEPVAGPLAAAYPTHAAQVLRPARPGHWMFDLPGANRLQLLDAGLRPDHIETMALCTSCRGDILFSQRRQGYPCGRFAAAIALVLQ